MRCAHVDGGEERDGEAGPRPQRREGIRNLAAGETELPVQSNLASVQIPTGYILGNLLRRAFGTCFPSSLFFKGYPGGRLLLRIRFSQ